MERWLEDTDYSRASYWRRGQDRDFHSRDSVAVGGRLPTHARRHHSREHHFRQYYMHDGHLTSVGGDRRAMLEEDQEMDDMPPTHVSEEDHIEQRVIVPVDPEKTHDEGHIDCSHGETDDSYDVDLSTRDTVVAVELTKELDPFNVEAETHGVEAIILQTSSVSGQQGKSMVGGA